MSRPSIHFINTIQITLAGHARLLLAETKVTIQTNPKQEQFTYIYMLSCSQSIIVFTYIYMLFISQSIIVLIMDIVLHNALKQ